MADFIEFEQSVVKLDKNGNKVLSNRLFSGEKIAWSGKTFAQVKSDLAAAQAAESAGGILQLKDPAEAPKDGASTQTLDPSQTSTIRGTYNEDTTVE